MIILYNITEIIFPISDNYDVSRCRFSRLHLANIKLSKDHWKPDSMKPSVRRLIFNIHRKRKRSVVNSDFIWRSLHLQTDTTVFSWSKKYHMFR